MTLRTTRIVEWVIFVLGIVIAAVIVLNDATYGSRYHSGRPFLNAAIITQTAAFWLSRDTLRVRGLRSLLLFFFWPFLYYLFFGYMDRPWFDTREPYSCDGSCFGWYSFENDSWIMYTPLLCASTFWIGAISLFFGAVFKVGRRWNKPIELIELDEIFTTDDGGL